jgi:hypothetical protein
MATCLVRVAKVRARCLVMSGVSGMGSWTCLSRRWAKQVDSEATMSAYLTTAVVEG